ncbi:carbohydrate ABC transporter permease [Burkholderia sp. MR1-5-21]
MTTATVTTNPPAEASGRAVRPSRLAPTRWATIPAISYLIIVTQVPLIATLYFSFHSWNLLYPARPVRFVGLANFAFVLSDSVFRTAIVNTVLFSVVPATLTTVVGLGLALLLNQLRWGRGGAYSLMFAPFLIMETVNPIIWKTMILNPIYGLLNWAITSIGFQPVDLITVVPRTAVMLMIVWQWSPFMMLILLAGLQTVSQETLEAARIDGANSRNQFMHITLPHLVPYLTVGVLIEAILLLPVFGPIYVGTYGGPGNQTTNLMFSVYRVLTEQYEIGRAAAGGLIAAFMTTIVAMGLLAYVRPHMERN